MVVVAVGIAGVVLHVTNQHVVPIDDVEGAIGGELEVDGAEVGIGAGEQILAEGGFPAGAVVLDLVLLDAEKADRVAKDKVALHFLGEVPGGDNFEPGGRANFVGGGNEIDGGGRLAAEGGLDLHRQGPVQGGAGGVNKEILTPAVEDVAPGIGDIHLDGALQHAALRAVAEESAIDAAHRAVRGLDVAVQKNAFAEHERAAGIGGVGTDGVVRIVGIEAAENDLGAVGLVVAVGVAEQDEVRLLGKINAFGGELEADGQIEVICKHGFLVGFAVAVGVFVDEQFVVGQSVAGAIGRIGGHHGDPKAALVVEGELHGVCEIGELFFTGEELDLVAFGNFEGRDAFVAREITGGAVFDAGLVVGGHGRQDMRLAVIDTEILLAAAGDRVDDGVAEGGHLAGLLDLVRVVLRAVGAVTPAVGVNTVNQVIVIIPKVVFLFHRAVHEGGVGFRDDGLGAKSAVGEEPGEVAIAVVIRDEAFGGERLAGEGVERLHRVENVDEREAVFLGDGRDGGGVELEVGVLFGAVGQVTQGGLVLVGDGRDEHDPGSSLAVVGFAQRVHHPGIEFGLEVGDLGRTVEGFIVAEERDEGVGFEVREPLVRRGEKALPFVDIEFGMEFLSARKRPLRGARGMGPETGRVADMAQVAEKQLVLGVT